MRTRSAARAFAQHEEALQQEIRTRNARVKREQRQLRNQARTQLGFYGPYTRSIQTKTLLPGLEPKKRAPPQIMKPVRKATPSLTAYENAYRALLHCTPFLSPRFEIEDVLQNTPGLYATVACTAQRYLCIVVGEPLWETIAEVHRKLRPRYTSCMRGFTLMRCEYDSFHHYYIHIINYRFATFNDYARVMPPLARAVQVDHKWIADPAMLELLAKSATANQLPVNCLTSGALACAIAYQCRVKIGAFVTPTSVFVDGDFWHPRNDSTVHLAQHTPIGNDSMVDTMIPPPTAPPQLCIREEECAICTEPLYADAATACNEARLACRHTFHFTCFWNARASTYQCPICAQSIYNAGISVPAGWTRLANLI